MKMLIGGKWKEASNGATFPVYNPATGELIDTVPAATPEDVEEALLCAKAAQKEWGALPTYKRAEVMLRFAQLVNGQKEELARSISREVGKANPDAMGECNNAVALFTGFAEKAKHTYEQSYPAGMEAGTEGRMQIVVREPIGVVAAIIPFNYPLTLFSHKVAPALTAGNAVVVKPASDCPLTLLRIGEIMKEAGLPDGVLNIITGRGEAVGNSLVDNDIIGAVSLTGSTEVGAKIAGMAAKHIVPATLELGGNDPFIILDDTDLEMAVSNAVMGRTGNAGQVCSSSKRFLVHNSIKEAFTDQLIAKLKMLKVGDPALPDTQMGCLINAKAAQGVREQVEHTVAQGATLALGGKENGAFFEPTVLTGVTGEMDIAKDMEVFGPVFPVIGFDTDEEAIAIANGSQYGLSSSIHSRDIGRALRMSHKLETGNVVINGCGFIRSKEMPYGGHKKSGIGNEGISITMEEFTRPKVIILKDIL